MLELLEGFPDDVVAVRVDGGVDAREYRDVLAPAVVGVLASHERARLFYEVATTFTGMAVNEAWHEAELGLEHPDRWERIAFVGDANWVHHVARLVGVLIRGEVRAFSREARAEAERWIRQH